MWDFTYVDTETLSLKPKLCLDFCVLLFFFRGNTLLILPCHTGAANHKDESLKVSSAVSRALVPITLVQHTVGEKDKKSVGLK